MRHLGGNITYNLQLLLVHQHKIMTHQDIFFDYRDYHLS